MPFTIDEESLLIKGRQGDTASFTFDFGQDISDYTVHFYVKRTLASADSVIQKDYVNPKTTAITVELTSEDTEKLTSKPNSFSTYYWGVKINNGTNFVQTIIPQDFDVIPLMNIYPEIGGV